MTSTRQRSEPNRRIERHLPQWWQARRVRKRARIAQLTRGRRIGRRLLIVGSWLTGSLAVLLILAIALFYLLSNVPRPEDLSLPQIATIQFADGTTMAKVGNLDRTIVSLDKVPAGVRWAVIAAEDRGFYSEPGISVRGMLRAAWSDVSGGPTQGGSTITQQYVKNAYLSSAQTLSRKLRELAISVKLDRNYSKDQILEFYLNTVYFGRGAYGIQAAAQTYFGVDVTALKVEQAAVLASLLRGPSDYDPAVHPQAAHDRWRYVLDGMVTIGHLTQAQDSAAQYPAVQPVSATSQLGDTGPNGLIIRQVYSDLAAHGITADDINTKGLTIRTTIDPAAQTDAINAVGKIFTGAAYQQNMKQALVAENPATGAVLAYYGGAAGDGFDYASQGTRPPGSSFKPFTLATALEQNVAGTALTPYAITSRINGSYQSEVEGVTYFNDPSDKSVSSDNVTIANAMKYSLNTAFVNLASDVGDANVATIARAAEGIPAKWSDGSTTLASNGSTGAGIGIGQYPVRVIDQATGYATIANGGTMNAPYFVQSVSDRNGATLYTHRSAGKRVLDPRVANDVTMTLEPVAAYSRAALAGNRASAAKTGTVGISSGDEATTQNADNGNSDAWMVGFTSQVSTAIWVGSGQNEKIVNASGGSEYGSDLPAKTWKLFMDTYLANAPKTTLPSKQEITSGVLTTTPTATATSVAPTSAPRGSEVSSSPPLTGPTGTAGTGPPGSAACTPSESNPC